MRVLEVLLCLFELTALTGLAVPAIWRSPWGGRLLRISPLAALGQILLEGPRWQMAPAYLLAVTLAGLTLVRAGRMEGPWRLQGPARAASLVGGFAAVGLATFLALTFPVFRFPIPDGPFGIGTVTYHWTDATRPEAFTADPTDNRELMVQVWYPVRAHAPGPRAPYLSDSAALSPLARLLGLPTFIFGHLKYVRTNAVEGAPVSSAATSFPLLIFSHGRGGYRQHNTFLVEALVSHGYVVAAIDHPYVAAGVVFPDGRRAEFDPRMTDRGAVRRVVPYLAQDARFVLDQLTAVNRSDPRGLLTNRIDLTRIGMFGVSLGGATTAQSCLTDARLRACLAIDVFMPADVVRRGLTQPTLWISRSADTMRQEGWKALDIDETQTTMRAVFDHLPGEGYIVRIPGAFHPNFADTPYLAAPWLAQRLGLAGPADPWRVHDIVKTVTLAFFDRELRDSHRPVDPRASFPEVGFEARPLPQAH